MKFVHAPGIESAREILQQLVQKPIADAPRKVDKPLILYGAGNLGRMAKQYFEKIGVPYKYVVDSNAELYRNDPFWTGVNIVNPKDVLYQDRSKSLLAVCVATISFSILRAELSAMGWVDLVPFYDIAEAYRDQHPLGNGWFSGKLDESDIKNIELVLSDWNDEISYAHYLQFIAWRALREDWLFDNAPVTINDRYFIPEVISLLRSDEIFCDVGAHRAEVIFQFLQATGNRFKEILAIEPDIDNLLQLRAALKKLDPEINQKIHVITCAVGVQEGQRAFFDGLGYASQLCGFGQCFIEVKTIDQLNLAPTFIKLHLEGGELDAMKGGLQTLQQHMPIIATTIYHNRQGLWELPLWLMNMLPNYRFFFRLHSWCGTGAVLYGVPDKRLMKKGIK